MTIDSKREEILKELKHMYEFETIPSEIGIKVTPRISYPGRVISFDKFLDRSLKDYGAIVEQQTRDAVIEECKTALLAEVYKVAGTMDTSWSDVNSAKAHIKLGLEESVNIINALKSKPTTEETL